MRCTICHGAENCDPAGVPGHEIWRPAPVGMAWQDKSLGEICAQIKDPERTVEELVDHMAEDGLIGWAWAETGAACSDV